MKKHLLGLALSLSANLCLANNPASTAYVDKQFTNIQQQINAINANPAITHPVGSCFGGGVVFYLNPNPNAPAGQRGLIVALTDAGVNLAWDPSGNTQVSPTTQTSYFTGLANTADILGTTNPQGWPAAQAAADFNTLPNAPCPGETCSNWYLPSQYELMQFYLASSSIANFGSTCLTGYVPVVAGQYWSSTQSGNLQAWTVDFDNGFTIGVGTDANSIAVRDVRAF